MPNYECSVDEGTRYPIEADSPMEAAEIFVAEGKWECGHITYWVNVAVFDLDDADERYWCRIEMTPTIPPCIGDDLHVWEYPQELVGDNEGVVRHKGGTLETDVCIRCGVYVRANTWAIDPYDDTQGLLSIEFLPADAASLSWIRRS